MSSRHGAASPASGGRVGSGAIRAGFRDVLVYGRRAVELVWATSHPLTLALVALTLLVGLLPAGVAWVGARIVDSVIAAVAAAGARPETETVFAFVALEALLVALLAAGQRGISTAQSLLRAQLGQRVNELILEKALTLELSQFEDAEFYDKLTRARREASSRPLSLVMRTFGLAQNSVALVSFAVLIADFSPWAVILLFLAGLPSFVAEAKFSGDAFRLFRWRSPETRMQLYLETVLAREDHAKEVQLYNLGPRLLDRYRDIFRRVYQADRDLTLRRDGWGFAVGLLGTAALYGAYAFTAWSAIERRITLGGMTMYVALFRQGQSAVSAILSAVSGMYEDNLYIATLYEFLETPVRARKATMASGPEPADGVRFEKVSFTYPGSDSPALIDIDLHIRPGHSLALVGENGSGKTTLIKLLTRLYSPSSGRILLDGLDLERWDEQALRRRIGVIFQDFARYQLLVGENIGAGDVEAFEDELRWRRASDQAMARAFIESMPEDYRTQLGKWFKDGRELSGGQWQKIALARAFMRVKADVLVLDEPTAAMDAAAEANVFEHFREVARDRIVILISHRFSTVRMADEIVVIQDGRIVERGSHDALMAADGHYRSLFTLQARGYR
ncbi:MAG: ABC transporter ATP-binding protein [Steroidobacteraceae bacterium]